MRELVPIVFVFTFGVSNRFFVHSSYLMSLFSKIFHMNDGFSVDRHFEASIFADSLCELFVHLFL